MPSIRHLSIFTALLLIVTTAVADDGADWSGRRVMVITPNAQLKQEEQVVGLADVGHLYTVEQARGNWLWVPTRGGWIHRRDVLPAAEAVDHFTALLERESAGDAGLERGESRVGQWLYYRGRAHDALGNLDAAHEDLSQAIRHTPTLAGAFNDRGNVRFKQGRLDEAFEDYTGAIRLDRANAVAYNNRSTVLARQGRLAQALEDLATALEIDPKYAEAWNNRGVLHRDQGNYRSAIADYSKAIELAPDYAAAYGNRGYAYKRLGDFRRALDDYRKAIELSPQSPLFRNDLAWLLATCPHPDVRNPKEAVREARLVIELAGQDDWNHLDTRAAAHAAADQFEDAVEWAQKALEKAPAENKAEVRQRLQLYEEGSAYRESRS